MTVFISPQILEWGALDVPLLGLTKDWHGAPVQPPAVFSLVVDPLRLWFIAHHGHPAILHPAALPGDFHAGLWRYHVAELFLADVGSGRYFEFNLAPNGAWWCCEFIAPRVRAEEVDIAMPDVATFADRADDGAWLAAMAIPLDLLRARLNFGAHTHANVAFILGTAVAPLHLSAAGLGSGTPDFHRPAAFPLIAFTDMPES